MINLNSRIVAAFAGGLLITGLGAAATVTLSKSALLATPAQAGPEATLKKIHETRINEIVKNENDFSFDAPGLVLTFGVDVPDGLNLLKVDVDGSLKATDAAGTDLSQIEPGFMGETEYIELVQTWEGSPTEFKLKLAPTSREATTFIVDTQLSATLYAGTRDHTLELSPKWTDVDAKVFAENGVQAKLRDNGSQWELSLQPGFVRDQIEKLELTSDGNTVESNMSMWNDENTTYYFDGVTGKSPTLTLTVRTGFTTVPITINLKDKPLP
ncbi:MAG: hypothetical protein AAF432_09460 [Planctomycetota bacterium]